jgi:hypothetical protein
MNPPSSNPSIIDASGRTSDWGRDLTRLRSRIEFLQEDLKGSRLALGPNSFYDQSCREILARMGEYLSMASNLEKSMQDLANETGFGVRWIVYEGQEIVVFPKP